MLHSQARDGGDCSDHDRSRKEENCGLSFFPKCVARIQPGPKSRLTAGGFLRCGPIIRPAHSALASARQPPQPGLSIVITELHLARSPPDAIAGLVPDLVPLISQTRCSLRIRLDFCRKAR